MIYLRPADGAFSGQYSASALSFEQANLRIVGAQIDLDVEALATLDDDVRRAVITGELGQAAGLFGPRRGPSILAPDLDDLTLTPTEEDEAKLCKLYGEGGACALP